MANNNENKILNVPHLRFPEFSGEWDSERLENLTVSIGDGLHSTPVYCEQGDYCFINGNNIIDGKVSINEKTLRVTKEEAYKYNAALLKVDTILMSINGTIGNVALYNGENIMLGKSACYINPSSRIVREYLFHILSSPRIQAYFQGEVTGTTIKNLSLRTIRGSKILLPSNEEQKKIARLFSLVDERIATQNKIIEKLQSLIKGIGDKLLFNEAWTTTRLCDILTERIEKSKMNNQHEVLSSTVKGIYSQREYFSKDIASENNVGYKIIHLHDIVLSPQNLWMGNINYNNRFDIGIVSPSYKIYKVSPKFDKHFIASMLRTHRALYNYQLVSEQGASVVRRNLNMEAFEQLTFKIPSYDLQVKIGHTLSLLQNQLDTAFATKQAYHQQKQYLLSQMFI